MEILLRYVAQGRSGDAETLDTPLSADAITIGSGSGATVQLLGRGVGGVHARIEAAGAGYRIICRRGRRIEVNGRACADSPLAVGDTITLGGHRLTVIAPPAGFDFAAEVQPNPSITAGDFEAAFGTNLESTWLSMQAMSWLLVTLTLALGFMIPLGTVYLHRHGAPSLRALPDDAFWTAGPLTTAHAQAVGKRCNACHRQMFLPVQDLACRECHKDTQDHVAEAHRDLVHVAAANQRCGECHAEHLGEASRRIAEDDHLCVDCHADPARNFGELHLEAVTGFEPRLHPGFAVMLQKLDSLEPPLAARNWTSERVSLATASERSNLTFSHAAHLEPSPGLGMHCGDCHVASADGEHFQPQTMEKTCATNGCHTLNFGTGGERQLPHGKPQEAVWVIEDYFSRKYLDPPPVSAPKFVRRLPDSDRLFSDEPGPCNDSPLQCAHQQAKLEIDRQFFGRGCHLCHQVRDNGSADVHNRFEVVPVRLTADYFAHARFPHKLHQIQGTLTGDAACESCHAQQKSKDAAQLLLPDIQRCFDCHRDQAGTNAMPGGVITHTAPAAGTSTVPEESEKTRSVTLKCISCHAYHPRASSLTALETTKR